MKQHNLFVSLPLAVTLALCSAENVVGRPIDSNTAAQVRSECSKLYTATQSEDWDIVIDKTHPALVTAMGGREKAKTLAATASATLQRQGIRTLSYEIGKPTEILDAEDDVVVFLPVHTVIASPDGTKAESSTFLVASRRKIGVKWVFIDGAGIPDIQTLRRILPGLPTGIALPEKTLRRIDIGYNFERSKPISYRVTEQSHTVGNIVGEAGAINTIFDFTVGYRLVLTPKKSTPDTTFFIVTCEKRKVDWTVFYGTNKLVLTMTDAGTIKGTANSEPVVQENDEFRQDVAGLYRTGEISVTRQGLVNICSGGKEFEEFWGRWERLFPLVFPARSVSVGDKWTRNFRHPSLSKMVLPFDSNERIVTERKQDLVVAGRTCSVFRITSQVSASPANQEIDVSGFTEAATLFDSNLGVLFRCSSKHKARSEITQSVHGKPVKLMQSTECSTKMLLEAE